MESQNSTDRNLRRLQAFKRLQTGRKGEDIACRFLIKNGYYIWKRNWRCKSGELDIIAYCDRRLRIIEVKTRQKHNQLNYPAIEAVTEAKLNRLEKLGLYFTRSHAKQMRIRGLNSVAYEAITVLLPENWLKSPEIIYYQNLAEGFDFRRINGC